MSTTENKVNIEEKKDGDGADTLKVARVTIPEGLKPGDVFTFKINEEDEDELEMVVPEDAKPGETIELLLADEDDDLMDEMTVSVALHPSVNASIVMSPFILDDEDEDEDDEDDDEQDGTNMMAWPAGVYLSQFLSLPLAKPILENKSRAIELGSGLGVAGLGLISAFNRDADSSNKKQIVLTDVGAAETLIKANFELNKAGVLTTDNVDVQISTLHWGDEEEITKLTECSEEKKFDLIIGSDLLYEASDESINSLTSSMKSLLKVDQGLILFAVRWRKPEEERLFFESMDKSGFEFILAKDYLTQKGSLDISEDDTEDEVAIEIFENYLTWKEFGSEASEKSKIFFSETKVNVEGVMVPLEEIDEEKIDLMEEEDFDEFEMRYIQIYVGFKKE